MPQIVQTQKYKFLTIEMHFRCIERISVLSLSLLSS